MAVSRPKGEAGISGEYGGSCRVECIGGPPLDYASEGVHTLECVGVGCEEIVTTSEETEEELLSYAVA